MNNARANGMHCNVKLNTCMSKGCLRDETVSMLIEEDDDDV